MSEETLLIEKAPHGLTVTLHRPKQRNSINAQLVLDLHNLLDQAERDPMCKCIVLQGESGFFCTGMDFNEVTQMNSLTTESPLFSAKYMELLKRFTTTPKIIISLVEGQVLAGGVGIVAASDLVIGSQQAQFALSEALWGLLPACVTPFLIRRIGFQKAYFMTLTTETIHAQEAHRIGLIDKLAEQPHESLRQVTLRLKRIHEETIHDLKAYFQKMWIITEAMEVEAISELDRLMMKPQVRANIKNFIEKQQFPWENREKIHAFQLKAEILETK